MTASPPSGSPPGTAEVTHPIVFFDGVCGLCNRVVDRLLTADRSGTIRFAPLQGETARRLLPPPPVDPQRWVLVYLDETGIHEQSDAALCIARRLGGRWTVISWLRIVPRFLRDAVYMWVARSRYRWYGRKDVCRIPTAAERGRFLQ